MDWPKYDENELIEKIVKIVIQINGKKRGLIETNKEITEEKLFEIINNDETITKHFGGKNVEKKIYIKNKLMNLII